MQTEATGSVPEGCDVDAAESVLDELRIFWKWCRATGYVSDLRDPRQHSPLWDQPVVQEFGWGEHVMQRIREANPDESYPERPQMRARQFALLVYSALAQRLHDTLRPALQRVDGTLRINSSNMGYIPTSVRKSVLVRDNGICQMCGFQWELPISAYKAMRPGLKKRERQVDDLDLRRQIGRARRLAKGPIMDHLIPVVVGGLGEPWNVCVLCDRCNAQKYNHLWPPAVSRAINQLKAEGRYAKGAMMPKACETRHVPSFMRLGVRTKD